MTIARALGLNPPGFRLQLGNFLAVRASGFPSLSLCFPTRDRELTPPLQPVLTLNHWEDVAKPPGTALAQ